MKTLVVWWLVFAIPLVPIGAFLDSWPGAALGALVALGFGLIIGGLMMAAGRDDRGR